MIMAAMLTVGPSLAAIGAVFFAGDAIAGEFESKTGFLLFTNPIKRVVLWIGKYLAGFIAVTLLIVFTYIIIAIALVVIYQQVPIEILRVVRAVPALCLRGPLVNLFLQRHIERLHGGHGNDAPLYLGDFRDCGECPRFHRQSLLVYDIGRRRQHYPALRKHGDS